MIDSSAEKGMCTIIYTYDKNPSIFCYVYANWEDFYWLVIENNGMVEEPMEIAEIISHRVAPVEKEDKSRWIKDWRVG